MDRRSVLKQMFIMVLAGQVSSRSFAATPDQQGITSIGDEVASLETKAKELGLPEIAGLPDIANNIELTPENWYREAATRLLGVMQRALAANKPDLVDEAANLLIRITDIERSPSEFFLKTRAKAPRFSSVKAAYADLYASCAVRQKYQSSANWYLDLVKLNKSQYQSVSSSTGVPWHFIAVIHGLECSFNFRTHLHNGDTLKKRTSHVPSGRPASGEPPFTWRDSAIDALTLMNYAGKKDWGLERTLYRLEAYNGWGYRSKKIAINSPYLWSFSQHYLSGKYASDGKYDASLVSQQCGAAVLLKLLTNTGEITW